ncbi:Tn3 family transposase [Burkholderia pseudomallei]|uniref:Tn3 family transposase n=1 Tax=Burkholderia pseudomallei TaxID=28450 RepID=UPI0009AC152B|nr:Tn3 family transposase [Burkholderia pseudomallei]MBH9656082.1 Tn3 family transposase [Burkholderia pseudomallei]QDH32748.1 Tn3 family transposase [Burkholderia pseudomallei]QDH43001.1 Tn3 family transposase [Burkholderia pseudomallei]RIV44715.1 hypothetical protein D2W70_29055 [Burkholderia pseudomallei]
MFDPALRQHVTAGPNKGEARNSLARAVCFDRLCNLHDRTCELRRHRASGLNLVVAAIMLWNSVYLERAVPVQCEQGASSTKPCSSMFRPCTEAIAFSPVTTSGGKTSASRGGFRPVRARSSA